MQTFDQKRIKSLDGLRGIAILLVLTYHLFSVGFLNPFFSFGLMGVELFFVLSGFLITGILLDTRLQRNFIRSFLIRRGLRTLPLYYAVLVIFAIIAPHFSLTKWFPEYQVYFWTHTSNILLSTTSSIRPLGHFWSLAIEEQFYLLWPFVILLITQRKLIALTIFLIAFGIFLRSYPNAGDLIITVPFMHLDGILIGALAAILVRTNPGWLFGNIKVIFAVCTILFVGFIWFTTSAGRLLPNLFNWTVEALFFGSLMVLSMKSIFIEKMLSNKFLFFFGKYSYGMYVFNSILYHFTNWAGADRLTENQKLIPYAGVFLLTVALSYLSYNLFELRFLQLKNKLTPSRVAVQVKRNSILKEEVQK